MRIKQIGVLLLLSVLLFTTVACGNGSASPKGEWKTEDGLLTIQFDDLTGSLTQNDGTQIAIDVLYSVSLGNIAFYADGTEIFLGNYTLEENDTVMVIQNEEMKEVYRLQKQE